MPSSLANPCRLLLPAKEEGKRKGEERERERSRPRYVIFSGSSRVRSDPLSIRRLIVYLAMSVFRAAQDRLEEIEVLMCLKAELVLDVS